MKILALDPYPTTNVLLFQNVPNICHSVQLILTVSDYGLGLLNVRYIRTTATNMSFWNHICCNWSWLRHYSNSLKLVHKSGEPGAMHVIQEIRGTVLKWLKRNEKINKWSTRLTSPEQQNRVFHFGHSRLNRRQRNVRKPIWNEAHARSVQSRGQPTNYRSAGEVAQDTFLWEK